jgi:hypothetical protein
MWEIEIVQKCHVINVAVWGYTCTFLTYQLMSGHIHASGALCMGKSLMYTLNRRLGEPEEPFSALRRRGRFLPPVGI